MTVGLFLALSLGVWALAEVVGKFILKGMDKRALSVLSAAVVNILYGVLVGGIGAMDLAAWGVIQVVFVAAAHDKLMEPLFILGKNELVKK